MDYDPRHDVAYRLLVGRLGRLTLRISKINNTSRPDQGG
jgi:hypothetical protein